MSSALEALKAKMAKQQQPNKEPDSTVTTISTTTSHSEAEIKNELPAVVPPIELRELTLGQQLSQKVEELGSLILQQHPTMPVLLREIHSTLLKYPEQVTLLKESEINTIVSGLQVQTGVFFASVVTKPKESKSATARIKKLGADAF